ADSSASLTTPDSGPSFRWIAATRPGWRSACSAAMSRMARAMDSSCMPPPSRQRLDLVGAEEELVPGLAQFAEVLAGVLVHGDGKVDVPLVVLLDDLDGRDPPRQGQVHDVGPAARRQPDAV